MNDILYYEKSENKFLYSPPLEGHRPARTEWYVRAGVGQLIRLFIFWFFYTDCYEMPIAVGKVNKTILNIYYLAANFNYDSMTKKQRDIAW